jgi:MPBQ/MSBQ methyltransferase
MLIDAIQSHYNRPDLGSIILAALKKAGKDANHLTVEDLAPMDELHVLGRTATLELAQAAELDASKHVLDIGSGIGGTSRCLAAEFGCRVTGIDLTDEYFSSAALLNDRVGLTHLLECLQGNATRLPFGEQAFDVAWTEHAAMNIPDKPRLYQEIHRVLKPGGTLAIYDVLAGQTVPTLYPVPWARTRSEFSHVAKRAAHAFPGCRIHDCRLIGHNRGGAKLVRIPG